MARVALSIGTNLGNRLVNLREAVQRLLLVPEIRLADADNSSKSNVFETAPWGVLEQPAFLNACLLIECDLEPESLLSEIKRIECEMGRVKNIRWGARKIDIDILLFDDLVYSSPMLQIPHVNLHERDFVLVPLEEILSDWRHPLSGLTVREMCEKIRHIEIEPDSNAANAHGRDRASLATNAQRPWPIVITKL